MASLNNDNAAKVEELVFHDMSFKRNEELQVAFRKPGPDGFYQLGILAEALPQNPEGYKSLVHFADPYQGMKVDENGKVTGNANTPMTIVSFPSYASVEEVEQIRNRVIPMPETCEMMQALAEAKEMSNILLIVGGTALGKTFAVKTFVKALYGSKADPLDFYCNGQTDVSELHGMWVPRLTNEQDQIKWRTFLESSGGEAKLRGVVDGVAETKGMPEDQRVSALTQRLKTLAQEIGLSSDTNWEFNMGAIPKAFTACFDPEQGRIVDFKPGGRGYPLHIQEVGLAAPRVVNALLEIRGDNGALSNSVQIWRNGGMQIMRGPDTCVFMTTNPDEEAGYQERHALDRALLRGVLPLRLKEALTPFSVHLATTRYFSYQAGNCPKEKPRGCTIELYHFPDDIGRTLATVVAAFHHSYTAAFKAGEGRGKSQTVVSSIDQVARLADYMLRFQVLDRKTGHPDLTETLKRGVERVYLRGLASDDKKEQMRHFLNTLLNGESLIQRVVGLQVTPAESLSSAVKEIMKIQQSSRGGYSQDLADEVRKARTTRHRNESDSKRDELLDSKGVGDTIKDLLRRKNP